MKWIVRAVGASLVLLAVLSLCAPHAIWSRQIIASLVAQVVAAENTATLRVVDLPNMTLARPPQEFGISSSAEASLPLKVAAVRELTEHRLIIRVFRSDPELNHPKPIATEDDGCEVFFSSILSTSIAGSDLRLGRLNQYWLDPDRTQRALKAATYILIVEEDGPQKPNPDVKLRPDFVQDYFRRGYKIVVSPDRALTRDEIAAVLGWAQPGPDYQEFIKNAKCLDRPNILFTKLMERLAGTEPFASYAKCEA